MWTRDEVTAVISELAEKRGLRVYDLDLPRGRRGVLRVFVCKGSPKSAGLTLDECAALSNDVLSLDTVEHVLPGETRLEVSSPGVNRKLRSEQHFSEAVGERIKVKARGLKGAEGEGSVVGILEGFKDGMLIIRPEEGGDPVKVEFLSVRSARVNFLFE